MGVRSIKSNTKPLEGVFEAPPSKSVTHRALVAAALARGRSVLHRPLDADDGRITRDGLSALGISIESAPGRWIVNGSGGQVPGGGDVFCGESGTSMRFLFAVAALGASASTLDGAPRLRERPVQELATALSALGASIRLAETPGGLPAVVGGVRVEGGRVQVASGRSSQFASALLLVGSRLSGGLEVNLEPPAVSLPYVAVTVDVLESFGIHVEHRGALSWYVPPSDYDGREFVVEGDHSSASYFLAAPAVSGGTVRVNGLAPDSKQPDARLRQILAGFGCRVEAGDDWIQVAGDGSIPGFDLDMSDCPDIVPTVAVCGLFANEPAVIRGIGHLRHKESDRLELVASNLRALGRHAEAVEDRLEIGPPGSLKGVTVPTASDHRMAMAFALAGLRLPGVSVDDGECVAKSNPGFWDEFSRLESGGRNRR